jgi:hypothetical protein
VVVVVALSCAAYVAVMPVAVHLILVEVGALSFLPDIHKHKKYKSIFM